MDEIDCAITELAIESLPDEKVLALCDMQMETQQQEVFSNLQARYREGQLNDAEVSQLDELMQVYRCGLVSKARALKVAVERRLKPVFN
ncbi:hypothetical protein IQ274_06680 [Nostoc sp. LEGE 12447]|uniref:hypothetical protein n=1 Tax=Nostoc sp. LEGE 12447 TaxID=1828640 RepID=UPI0018842E3A|nr:hypothetical protein [Nostoc sp. LEGE 12447]MBE8997908.1 hypothetical protein [Nostoc sp. LEGE 12447]